MKGKKFIKATVYVIMLTATLIVFTQCKKCYTCRAYQSGIDKMIDFEQSCDEEQFQTMEDTFRVKYPESDGYYVMCN